MKTITIEHEVAKWNITFNPQCKPKYYVMMYNKFGDYITSEQFKTFDEAVKYVKENLL